MRKAKKTKPSSATPASTPAAALPRWLARPRWVAVALFVVAVLAYGNTFRHQYALDDALVITDNMFTTAGLAGWPGIFGKDTFFGFFKEEGKARLVAGGRYRPLSLALFAFEYQLWGDAPGLMHLSNALWYGLTVVVLFWLVLGLMRAYEGPTARATYLALGTAVLFALHPLHTEVVANIKGRDEILALLGSLTALLVVLRAQQAQKNLLAWLALPVFFLALLAKENAITFLAVAPAALWVFVSAKPGVMVRYTAPLAVAAVLFLVVRGQVIGWEMGPPVMELMNNPFVKLEGGRWVAFSAGERLATIVFCLGKYLQLLVWPYPLTHDYYPRHIELMTWADWRVGLSLLAYLGLAAYAVWGVWQRRVLGFAAFYFLATLSIVSNIVFPVGTNLSERFLFMPSVAFALATAWAAYAWCARAKGGVNWPTLGLITAGLAIGYGALTVARNPVWENSYTLFTSDIQTSPNSAKLRNAVAGELLTQWLKNPNGAQQLGPVQEALGHLREALRIHPTYKNAYLLQGNAYNYLQDYPQSIASYQRALDLDPGYQDAITNLTITYRDAGRHAGEKLGNLELALRYLNEAYQRNPRDYETLRLLGVAHGTARQIEQAISYFEQALKLAPDSAGAWFDLGTAYYNAGRIEEANTHFAKARALDPEIEQKRGR